MHRESIGFYIFRLLLMTAILGFVAMLYWSSALIEQNIKLLRSDVSLIKSSVGDLTTELSKLSETQGQKTSQPSHEKGEKQFFSPENAQENSPDSSTNLLTIDPFYTTTLPKLLGPHFKAHGIRKEATVGRPDNLHPFSNWAQVSAWIGLCTSSISAQHFGIYETFAPDMALKMELRRNKEGQPEFWLHLRRNAFWQPLQPAHFAKGVELAPEFLQKHPVTAHDFKFFFDAVMNPHVDEAQAVALRLYYNDIKEIEVVDDFTFVVRWKTKEIKNEKGEMIPQMKYMAKMWTAALRPLPSFVYKYFADGTKIITNDEDPDTYRTNSIWAQNFAQHWAKNVIVSCGPYMFDGMTDREIRFVRNPDYYEPYAALVEAIEVKFKDSPDGVWEDFKSGALDLFNVPPNQLAEFERFLESTPYQEQVKKGLGIKRINYVDRAYTYIGWNQAKVFFKSQKVRQALTMAIDRQRIIQQNLNGMGIEITGPFFRFSPSYDESLIPYPFDLSQARTLLEEEGWYDSDGDGIINQVVDGQSLPFEFTLTYYVKNPTTKSISEYVSTALKEVGIVCHLNGVDIADLSAIFEDKNFDSIYLGWALGSPPEDPKQLWYSKTASQKGSSNAIGFSNEEIDRIIDQLEYEYDYEKRLALYHQFDRIIYEEAPYVFLYTPKVAMIYRDYLQNVFIPVERQDLIPGANIAEPQSSIFWIKESNSNGL